MEEEKRKITLKNVITINGVPYFGTIEVPKSLAEDLLYRDGLLAERENLERRTINKTDINIGVIR